MHKKERENNEVYKTNHFPIKIVWFSNKFYVIKMQRQQCSVRSLIKVQCNCHFPAPGWNSITQHQELKDFADTSHVSLNKNNKVNLHFYSIFFWRPESDCCVQLCKWTQWIYDHKNNSNK
jgi:hypothetical protein